MPAANPLTAELRALPAALAFLTRLPVGRWIALDAAAPEIPCLTFFTLADDTTSGQHERVRRVGGAGT